MRADYYTQFRRKPIGRWHLQMCRYVSCSMRGAERILGQVEQHLGVKPGESTPDGRVTLSTAECRGACGPAQMMMVNDGYHENLTQAKLVELLEGLKYSCPAASC